MLFKDENYLVIESMEQLTHDAIIKVVRQHSTTVKPKLTKYMKYYKGEHDILKKPKTDEKAVARIVNGFPRQIVDQITAMFMSKGIKYQAQDERALLELKVVSELNEHDFVNYLHAQACSIYGYSAELLYMDENAEVRYSNVDPTTVIPIYGVGIANNELIGAIRYFTIESLDDAVEDKHMIDIYDKHTIKHYINVSGSLKLLEEEMHYFGDVPCVIFMASDFEQSDIHSVISLVDAYDELMSSTSEVFSYFSDCYLLLKGAQDTDASEFADMKRNRILLLPEEGDATFLTKQMDSASLSQFLKELKDNIYKFSYAIDLTDATFGNTAQSGISLRYRLMQLESVCSSRERLFTQAINRRNKMIFNILGVKGRKYEASEITQVYTRCIPADEVSLSAMAQQLTGILSKETILGLLPMVDDIEAELKRLEDEQANNNAMLDPYMNAFPQVEDEDDENEIPPIE